MNWNVYQIFLIFGFFIDIIDNFKGILLEFIKIMGNEKNIFIMMLVSIIDLLFDFFK